MTVFRYSLLGLLLVFSLLLAGCGDVSERLHGAWKSEQASADGKHTVIIFTKDTVNFNGTMYNITYTPIALTVEVVAPEGNEHILSATRIEKKDVIFQGGKIGAEQKFLRIEESEAQQLLGN